MRVLLTGVGGPAGRSLAQQLEALGHQPVGVDMVQVEHPALVAAAVVPAASDPAMVDVLLKVIQDHGVDAVIPSVSDELPAVARAADARHFPVPVVISSADAVAAAHDKYLTMQALDAAGVAVPRYRRADAFASAERALDYFGTDIVVKPRVGRGSRGVVLVRRGQSSGTEGLWTQDRIVQELAPGQEYAPMVHLSPVTGERVAGVVAKVQPHGAVGTEQETVRIAPESVPDVVELAWAAAAALGLRGPVDLDVRRLANGTPVVLEINARFGANSALAPNILAAVLKDLAAVMAPQP